MGMTEMQLTQGVAVVTGAAGGMGAATARALAQAGYGALLLCDLDPAQLEAVAAPLRAKGAEVSALAGDIADPAFPGELVARLAGRPIAALVHTAGLSPRMGTAERILEVNLGATVRLVDAIRGHMAPGSAAVLIASNSAHFPMPPEIAAAFGQPLPPGGIAALAQLAPDPVLAYPMSKLGVMALVKREAKRFGERGARIVSISPGAIDTRMVAVEEGNEQLKTMIANQPIPRVGKPEEIAAVAVFLCSASASFLTATDVLVDGGMIASAVP